MTLSRKKMKTIHTNHPFGITVGYCHSIKYLDLMIQCDLTWSNHIHICSKARRLVGLLFHQFYYYAEPSTNKTLYLTLIRQNLECASTVWVWERNPT